MVDSLFPCLSFAKSLQIKSLFFLEDGCSETTPFLDEKKDLIPGQSGEIPAWVSSTNPMGIFSKSIERNPTLFSHFIQNRLLIYLLDRT